MSESFVGTRSITARAEWVGSPIGLTNPPHDADREAFNVALEIDGVLWMFSEDPNDGWRSSCREPIPIAPSNVPSGALVRFTSPMVVTLRFGRPKHYGVDDVLYAIDERTGLLVFEIGTGDVDDWYPSFVHSWTPEGCRPDWLEEIDNDP